jgi:hypothetical protein
LHPSGILSRSMLQAVLAGVIERLLTEAEHSFAIVSHEGTASPHIARIECGGP